MPGVDVDELVENADGQEVPFRFLRDPPLVPVTEGGARGRVISRLKVRGVRRHRVPDPVCRDDLTVVPLPLVEIEQPEACIVPEDHVKTAESELHTIAVHDPVGVGFHADYLPDLLLQIGREVYACGFSEHHSQYLAVHAHIMMARSRFALVLQGSDKVVHGPFKGYGAAHTVYV